jgi:glycosyltransferase involved in cell wall biosynthesis
MRILFCVPERVTTDLGAPKVYVELAAALEELGCTCEVVGLEDVAPGIRDLGGNTAQNEYYSRKLKQYINARADEFDVVEYDHQSLPYPRSDFPDDVLLVARSVLLAHHSKTLDFPIWRGIPVILRNAVSQFFDGECSRGGVDLRDYFAILKKHLGTAVRYRRERAERHKWISQATTTCRNADLVIVSNAHDRRALAAEDIDLDKVVQLPFGLTEARFQALSTTRSSQSSPPTVVFVGTFDFRKGGATDLPRIVERISGLRPAVRFRLLGTRGLFTTKEGVLGHFSHQIRDRIEVVPQYSPKELPELLRGGSIGVFPSYWEGFPFAVLEMLAAGLPVVAYDAPGAPEMLPDRWIVPAGGWRTMAEKVGQLLDLGSEHRCQPVAKRRAESFRWGKVATRLLEQYSLSGYSKDREKAK